jgi:hypothetical protein
MPGKLAPGDVVTVTRIDRLARSTFDLFGIVKRIVRRNSVPLRNRGPTLGLRPILGLPLAIFAFAAGCLLAVSKAAIPPQLAPYTALLAPYTALLAPYAALVAPIVMAAALFLAVRIGLATTPKPTLKFADALTLVFGVSRYEITGTTIKYEALDDFALALTQSAAIEEIFIWGSRVPIPAFQRLKSALVV